MPWLDALADDLLELKALDLEELLEETSFGMELLIAGAEDALLDVLVNPGVTLGATDEAVEVVNDGLKDPAAAVALYPKVISGAQKDITIAIFLTANCQFKPRFNCKRLIKPSSIRISPKDVATPKLLSNGSSSSRRRLCSLIPMFNCSAVINPFSKRIWPKRVAVDLLTVDPPQTASL